MAIITSVYETRGVYHISLDGRESFKLDKKTFKTLGLKEGDDIDIDAITEKAEVIQLQKAYESALYMLDRSAKTATQIKNALVNRGYLDAVADKCVIRLMNAKLINDEDYAKRIVQQQSYKAVSKYAIKQKLLSKGVSGADAERALDEITDESQSQAVKALARKLSDKYGELDPREARRKLSMALARRGFGWDDVKAAVDEIYNDDDEY